MLTNLAAALAAGLVTSALANPVPPAILPRQEAAPASPQVFSANPADYPVNSTVQFGGGASGNTFDYSLTTKVLNNTNLNFQPQPYVANGYFGARIPAAGVGYQEFQPTFNNATFHNGTQGWPLFTNRQTTMIITGFYCQVPFDEVIGTNFDIQPSQQVISLLPAWTGLYVSAASNATNATDGLDTYLATVDPATVSNFSQSMNIRDGVVQTNVTWNGLQLTYTVFAHRLRPNVGAMRLDISGIPDGQSVVISDTFDGTAAKRVMNETAGIADGADNVIYSAAMPQGVFNVTGWQFSALEALSSQLPANTSVPSTVASAIGSNLSTIAQSYNLTGPTVSVVKYVGVASSDAYAPAERDVAFNASVSARETGWDALLAEHRQEWEAIWQQGGDVQIVNTRNDSVLNGLQTMARASWFNLLTNLRRGDEAPGLGDQSIAPAGLASDAYATGKFWDGETFMLPSLIVGYPDFGKSINNYRSRNLGAAIQNNKNAPFVAGESSSPLAGATFPWVSFRYGNATGIGPSSRYEQHLENDISLAQWTAWQASGNMSFLELQVWPILKNVAEYWASQVVRTESGKYAVYNITDPDEYATNVSCGAFTMTGINKVMNWAIEAAELLGLQEQVGGNWSDIATNVNVLYTNSTPNITLEFEGFNNSLAVKQADVAAEIYPMEAPAFLQPNPLADLQYYAGRTSANGPGMTYSIFSIDSAQLAPSGCEPYTYFRQAAEPYARLPYYMFSEQTNDLYAFNGGTNPAFPFLTGMGGYLQTFFFGFGGMRFRTGRLYLDPNLPPQLEEGLNITGLQYLNRTFDILIGGNETTITLRSGDGTADIQIADANSKAGNYTLTQGQNLRVPTRRVDLGAPSFAGNIAQCRNTTTNSTWTPGNFDIAAVDGSNSTFWQSTTNETTALTVDLGSSQNVSSLHINWGLNPALTMQAFAGNDLSSLQQIVNATTIQISAPYDPATADIVQLTVGNTTDAALAQPVTARYVQLVVNGCMMPDAFGHGATIAELNVLG